MRTKYIYLILCSFRGEVAHGLDDQAYILGTFKDPNKACEFVRGLEELTSTRNGVCEFMHKYFKVNDPTDIYYSHYTTDCSMAFDVVKAVYDSVEETPICVGYSHYNEFEF